VERPGTCFTAALPRTAAAIGDRFAFAEMTFSDRVPAGGEVGQEVAQRRKLGWLPPQRAGRAHARRPYGRRTTSVRWSRVTTAER
jgi:hypothetical protein